MTESEYLERLKDPKFFCETALFCVNKDSKKVPFIWNKVQNDYYEHRTHDDTILKARKMGFSLQILAIWLHACIFQENTRAVVISHEEQATKRLLERVRYFIATSLIPINTKKNSESEISFPDTSSTFWIGTAGQKAFGRGDDVTHLHASEFLWYADLSVLTGIGEALRNEAWVVNESTANGAGNAGHKLWMDSMNGRNDSKPHFYGWQWDEEYTHPDNSPISDITYEEKATMDALKLTYGQMRWKRNKIRKMKEPDKFVQEYPSVWEEAFLASGQSVFTWQEIKKQEDSARPCKIKGHVESKDGEVEFKRDKYGSLEVYLTPENNKQMFLVSADAAEGIEGGDFSSCSVWDIKTWEQCAHWHGLIDPMAFAYVVYNLGKYYNWAWLVPETNYPGNATYKKIQELKYPARKLWVDKDTKKPWMTQGPNRSEAVSCFRESIRQDTTKINSPITLNEMRTFIRSKANKLEAESGCHDDCVMEACIGAYVLKHSNFEPTKPTAALAPVWVPKSFRRG